MSIQLGERRAALTKEHNRRQAAWNTVLGVVIIGALSTALGLLWVSVGGLPTQMVPEVLAFWGFLMVPGLVYVVLGVWYYIRMKRVEQVIAPERWTDYGTVLAQLSPGVALSAIGIWLNETQPEIIKAVGGDRFDWGVLALATLVSVVVVRRTKDKV